MAAAVAWWSGACTPGRGWRSKRSAWEPRSGGCLTPIRHVYLLTIVMIGWVILRADTPSGALAFLQAMAGLNGLAGRTAKHYLTLPLGFALGVAIVGAGPMVPAISRWRVSLDAATVSVLMMIAATGFFLWRGVTFLVGPFLPTRR